MGILKYVFNKFSLKTGLAAGAVYYTVHQGVWSDSVTTTKLYDKISESLEPYTKQASEQIPVKLPDLPSSGELSYLATHYWNRGVKATFAFLRDLPSNSMHWSIQGYHYLGSRPELQNLFKSESKQLTDAANDISTKQ